MAASCTINPQVKNKAGEIVDSNLWKELRSVLPYDKARTAYLFTKSEFFNDKYGNSSRIEYDANNEPTYQSIRVLMEMEDVIDQDSQVAAEEKKIAGEKDAPATRENIDRMDDAAIEYNESDKRDKAFAATTDVYISDDGSERVRIRVARNSEKSTGLIREMINKRRLNRKLRTMLKGWGVNVDVLSELQQKLRRVTGITDFQSSVVSATGMANTILIARGAEGIDALPEEFAHFVIEALHDSPLIKRLYSLVLDNDLARTILGDEYEQYRAEYERQLTDDEFVGYKKIFADNANRGETATEHTELEKMLAYEAIGHLIYERILMGQNAMSETQATTSAEKLTDRLKAQFKKTVGAFDLDSLYAAISEAQDIAGEFSNNLMKGEYNDRISVANIATSAQFYQLKSKAEKRKDLLEKLIENAQKRYRLYSNNERSFSYSRQKSTIADMEAKFVQLEYNDGIMSFVLSSLDQLRTLGDQVAIVQESPYMPIRERVKMLQNIRKYYDSYVEAIRSISEAYYSGILEYSQETAEIITELNVLMCQLKEGYDNMAKPLWIELLRQYMGDGITIPTGKMAGHKYTAEEIAEYADKDISILDRLLDSAGESGDWVIRIMDNMAKEAKHEGRTATNAIKKQLLGAWNKLKAAGYTNTDFMYKVTTDENGKRNVEFIEPEDAGRLSKAQQEYYYTIMRIKDALDAKLPENTTTLLNSPQIRKSYTERLSESLRAGNLSEAWEDTKTALKEQIMRQADDKDFGGMDAEDFNGNPIETLPIYFIRQAGDPDDISRDTTSTMLMYANMVNEFHSMNKVVDTLEFMRDQSEDRAVLPGINNVQGRKTYNAEQRSMDTNKQSNNTNIHIRMREWFSSNVYGRYMKDAGTFGESNVDKGKVANALNKVTALNTYALNLLAGIANVVQGSVMMRIESVAGEHFKWKDVAKADATFWKELGAYMSEIGVTNKTSKLALFDEMFNVMQDFEAEIASKDAQRSRMGQLLQSNSLYFISNAGEFWMQNRTALALAMNYEMRDANGNKTNLWDALEVKIDENGVGRLVINDGYTKPDGSKFSMKDEFSFQTLSKSINQDMHGIYNYEDRNALQRTALGRMAMMYRKWIKPAINRRYGHARHNFDTGTIKEGYYRTLGRFLMQVIHDARLGQFTMFTQWDKITEYERKNLIRAFTELGHLAFFSIGFALLKGFKGGDDDDKDKEKEKEFEGFGGGKFGGAGAGGSWGDEDVDMTDEEEKDFTDSWFFYTLMATTKRAQTEMRSVMPTVGMPQSALNIIQSPAAAVNTAEKVLRLPKLLIPMQGTYTDRISQGQYKGRTQAYKIIMDCMPFYPTIGRAMNPKQQIQFYK